MNDNTLTMDAVIKLAVIAGRNQLDESAIILILEAARQIADTGHALAVTNLTEQADAGNVLAIQVLNGMFGKPITVHDFAISEAYRQLYTPWKSPGDPPEGFRFSLGQRVEGANVLRGREGSPGTIIELFTERRAPRYTVNWDDGAVTTHYGEALLAGKE